MRYKIKQIQGWSPPFKYSHARKAHPGALSQLRHYGMWIPVAVCEANSIYVGDLHPELGRAEQPDGVPISSLPSAWLPQGGSGRQSLPVFSALRGLCLPVAARRILHAGGRPHSTAEETRTCEAHVPVLQCTWCLVLGKPPFLMFREIKWLWNWVRQVMTFQFYSSGRAVSPIIEHKKEGTTLRGRGTLLSLPYYWPWCQFVNDIR